MNVESPIFPVSFIDQYTSGMKKYGAHLYSTYEVSSTKISLRKTSRELILDLILSS